MDLGYSLVELIIGLAITFLLSAGVFQLFKLGYKTVNGNAVSASENSFFSSISSKLIDDVSHSSGVVISSASEQTVINSDLICTSWNSSKNSTFTQIRPLITVKVAHSASITAVKVSSPIPNDTLQGVPQTYTYVYTFKTKETPDLEVGEKVSITGLPTLLNQPDFNISNLAISVVKKDSNEFTVTDISTVSSADPNQSFSTPGIAVSYSYSGYELRASTLGIDGSSASSELWKVTCFNQSKIEIEKSIRLGQGLSPIDVNQNSTCFDSDGQEISWVDWSCAVKCPQLDASSTADASTISDGIEKTKIGPCPKDVLITLGQRSFIGETTEDRNDPAYTNISPPTGSYYLSLMKQNGNTLRFDPGMSIDFLRSSPNQSKATLYVTEILDLGQPSFVMLMASCGADVCDLPEIGTRVVVGASISIARSFPASELSKSETVENAYTASPGMAMNLGSLNEPKFIVIENVPDQVTLELHLPAAPISSPKTLVFSQPTGLKLSIPRATRPGTLGVVNFIASRAG